MIESLHQIDFISASGSMRLLDIGAIVESEPVITWKQAEQNHGTIGGKWGESQALGNAMASAQWTAVRNHSSHADLRGFCMRHAASMPSGETGTLRVTISGGEVWDIEDCSLSSSSPMPLEGSATFETVTAYSATGGQMVPAAAITLYAGIPWIFILQDWDALTGEWDDL
ncbi:MAG: hypothetical protein MUF86_11390 [Akkermansiaceae bacterium]|nr:hypothetical protein [Akkermansiaceae bacterium]MCU0778256.1 hypothetical protein [Akkermansiaceae bacterium]